MCVCVSVPRYILQCCECNISEPNIHYIRVSVVSAVYML